MAGKELETNWWFTFGFESEEEEGDSDCRTPNGRGRIYAASFAARAELLRRIIKVRCAGVFPSFIPEGRERQVDQLQSFRSAGFRGLKSTVERECK